MTAASKVIFSTYSKGYNTLDCQILDEDGQPLSSDYPKRNYLLCVQCNFIVKLANQLDCGDRICQGCLPDPIRSFKCPACGVRSNPKDIFKDKAVQHDIKGLIVVCKCGEKHKIEEWEVHSKTCAKLPDNQTTTIIKRFMSDKNTIKIRYLKMFFIGPPKVGKTLTRLRLCNEIENMKSMGNTALPDSTLLANCNQILMYVNNENGQNTWIAANDMFEEAQILLSYMVMADKNEGEVSPEGSSIASVLPKKDYKTPEVVRIKNSQSADNHTQQPISEEADKIMTRFQKLIRSIHDARFTELFNSSILINIHDIGGQPGFLEMIPALISGPAVYLVFLNLALPLNQLYEIPFSRDGFNNVPFESVYTVKSTISQILSAISSIDQQTLDTDTLPAELKHFSNIKPVATMVGTHLDHLSSETDSLKELQSKFSRILSAVSSVDEQKLPANIAHIKSVASTASAYVDKVNESDRWTSEYHLKQKHEEIKLITDNFKKVIVNPASDKSYLAVNNFSGTEESDLSALRSHITQLITGRLDAYIPIRPAWLIFSIILREEHRVAPLSLCLEIGKNLKMDEDEIKSALWYLHHIVGALMYYPDLADEDIWFEENVICSPQVIFDSISEVIITSMKILHSDVPVRECFRRDWIDKGVFSLEAVEEALRGVKHETLIPNEKLVKLLKHVNLLSEIEVISPPSSTPSIQLFMPAILECASSDALLNPPPTDDNCPAPIFLMFEFGYVPTGVFCGLITRILKIGSSKTFGQKWDLKTDHVKRNKVSFYVGGLHMVTLLSHDVCYEIRVQRRGSSTPLQDLCSQVLVTVLYILKEAYRRLEPIIAFQCPCGKRIPDSALKHLCELSDSEAICRSEDGGPFEVQLRDDQKVWIGKCVSVESEVRMKIAKCTPEDMTFHWYKDDKDLQHVSNTLNIASVTKDDFGVYKVQLKQKGEILLTIYRYVFSTEPIVRDLVHVLPLTVDTERAIAEFKRRTGLSEAQLDAEITDYDLPILAACFGNYNDYLDRFGLNRADRMTLKSIEYREDFQAAMREALRYWRTPNSATATYRALLGIVLSLKKTKVAKDICKYIAEHIPAPAN